MGELYPIWNIDSQIDRGMGRGGIFATAFQPAAEMSGLWMAILVSNKMRHEKGIPSDDPCFRMQKITKSDTDLLA